MILWSEETNLYLFTQEEFELLPDGIELENIGGTSKIKGKDNIDQDTRWGYLVWGVVDPWNHPLKDWFVTFLLMKKE